MKQGDKRSYCNEQQTHLEPSGHCGQVHCRVGGHRETPFEIRAFKHSAAGEIFLSETAPMGVLGFKYGMINSTRA